MAEAPAEDAPAQEARAAETALVPREPDAVEVVAAAPGSPRASRLLRVLFMVRLTAWLVAWGALCGAVFLAGRVVWHQPTTLEGVLHVALHGRRPERTWGRPQTEASSALHQAARNLKAEGLVTGRDEKAYRHLLRLTPDHPDLNLELGELLLDRKVPRLAEAEHYLERAVRVDPTNGYAYARLGEAHIRQGDQTPGLEARRKAKDLGADLRRIDEELARFFLSKGNYDRAVDFFKRADPEEADADLQYLMAQAIYAQGCRLEAWERCRYFTGDSRAQVERHLGRAFAIDPTHEGAQALRAKL